MSNVNVVACAVVLSTMQPRARLKARRFCMGNSSTKHSEHGLHPPLINMLGLQSTRCEGVIHVGLSSRRVSKCLLRKLALPQAYLQHRNGVSRSFLFGGSYQRDTD